MITYKSPVTLPSRDSCRDFGVDVSLKSNMRNHLKASEQSEAIWLRAGLSFLLLLDATVFVLALSDIKDYPLYGLSVGGATIVTAVICLSLLLRKSSTLARGIFIFH